MKKLYFLLFLFVIFFFLSFSLSSVLPLVDDSITFKVLNDLIDGKITNADVFHRYLNEPGRMVRPLSGLFMAIFVCICGFFQNTQSLFFLTAFLFVALMIVLYKNRNTFFSDSSEYKFIFLLTVFIFPFSSSTLFAPMLSMVSFLWILYIYSLKFILKDKVIYFILAGLLTLISALTVEYFIPFIAINFLIIYKNQKEKKWLKIFLATLLPILLFFVYRTYVAPAIYPNFSDYTSEQVKLNFESISNFVIGFFKTYTLDYLFVIGKAFLNIKFYTFLDFLCVGIALYIAYTLYKRKFHFQKINNQKLMLYLVFFALTYFIFIVSKYKPSIFEFNNRTMGLARISNALVFITLFAIAYQKFTRQMIRKLLKIALSLFIFINAIVIISEKNAWIDAGKFNYDLVQNLKTVSQNNKMYNTIITYDKYSYPYWVADEPIARFNYEFMNYYDIYKIPYFQTNYATFKDQPLYCLFKKPLNGLKKNLFEIKNDTLKFHERNFTFPLYIFNFDTKKLKFIQDANEFKSFQTSY